MAVAKLELLNVMLQSGQISSSQGLSGPDRRNISDCFGVPTRDLSLCCLIFIVTLCCRCYSTVGEILNITRVVPKVMSNNFL